MYVYLSGLYCTVFLIVKGVGIKMECKMLIIKLIIHFRKTKCFFVGIIHVPYELIILP